MLNGLNEPIDHEVHKLRELQVIIEASALIRAS